MKQAARVFLTRSLVAGAMVVCYGLSFIGVSSFVGVPKAEAYRGRGGLGFRGGRRGFGRRGRGFWWGGPVYTGYYDSRCYWSPRWGRYVCPYAYYPYGW
jgi:hypothetical protein